TKAARAAVPPQRKLSESDAKRIGEVGKTIDAFWRAGKFAEAVGPARQAVAVCEKALGPDHWQTSDARRKVETLETIAALPEEGRRALAATLALSQEFMEAYGKARYADAERLGRQIVEVRRRWLGGAHPDTAASRHRVANALYAQGDLAEAEALYRKALALRLKALGEGHPGTAASYNYLANALIAQGKLAEAEATHRKALAIRLKAL